MLHLGNIDCNTRVFSRYFQSIGKWISGCVNNTRRLQKTTEYYGRAKKYVKGSLMIYSDSWEYLYAA